MSDAKIDPERPPAEALADLQARLALQKFDSHQDWVRRATRRLTAHDSYFDANQGDNAGYRGPHFTAICFDAKGRRCWSGMEMRRAEADGAFPVSWIWPDQAIELAMLSELVLAGQLKAAA